MTVPPELDVSKLSEAESLLRVYGAFDRLEPGESLVVRSRTELSEVLAAMRSNRKELFDWFVLEDGPGTFEIEICRRRDAVRQHIGAYMERDHRRLERLLGDVESRTSDRMFGSALRRLHHLEVGLTNHIHLEERFLFPQYERIAPEAGALVRRLEGEHAILLRHVALARAALNGGDLVEAESALSDVREVLIPHARNEVRLVYPVIDLAHRADAAELSRSLQSH